MPPEEPRLTATPAAGGGSRPASPATLDQLLVEAAIQCPEADALIGDFGSMSYADLLIRAQNIALVLKRRGVGPGKFIGVLMTQSPAAIMAIAGVVLAGAAYVPVYQQFVQSPACAKLAARAGVSLVLWDKPSAPASLDLRRLGIPALDLARMEQETMPSSMDIVLPSLPADAAASRILSITPLHGFATVSHRGISRLICSKQIVASLRGETVLLQSPRLARPSFFETWGALLHGGALALAPDVNDTAALADWVVRQRVSVVCLPLPRVHEAIDQHPHMFSHLRYLVIENDGRNSSASVSRLQSLMHARPCLQIVNVYGTEKTAGYATAYQLPKGSTAETHLPIGQPLEGTHARIVGESLELLRAGEMGQLVLLGESVAQWTEDGEAGNDTSRIQGLGGPASHVYLTGERARLRAGGLVELHGRLAPQLLTANRAAVFGAADVEAMLSGQKHVREAVVVAGHDQHGRPQTVAFVAMKQEVNSSPRVFEETLEKLLPHAARPAAVRYVEEMPRDTFGAVDRFALQQRWKKESEHAQQFQGSQQEVLQLVRSLWLRLLQREFVGYEEDFFAAGGTQVQMIRMHAELNRRFPGAISMNQLAVLTTMRKLCEHLLDYVADDRRRSVAQRGA